MQDVVEGHHAKHFVNIGPTDHWQKLDLVCSHTLERQVECLIRVDVGKMNDIHEFCQLLISAFSQFMLQSPQRDNADGSTLVSDEPRPGVISAKLFNRLPDREFAGHRLGGRPHDPQH